MDKLLKQRHRVSEWIKKKPIIPNYMPSTGDKKEKDSMQLVTKRAEMAIFISDKTDFK